MTIQQLKEIKEDLTLWSKERNLTIDIQRQGIIGNLAEELTEFYRANDKIEQVDALCDMIVFSLNAIELGDLEGWREKIKTKRETHLYLIDFTYYFSYILGNPKSELGIYNTLIKICEECSLAIQSLGFDDYLCMKETIKEISSRVGSYDESKGKWVKNLSKKHLWVKADYDRCKLDSN